MVRRGRRFVDCIHPAQLIGAAALFALALWAYWPSLAAMARSWINDPQYSHGYLAPLFAIVLLWLRSNRIKTIHWGVDWRALLLFAISLVLRGANLLTWNVDWLDGFAFILSLAGIFALVGGTKALKWAWPAVAFLMFMMPLPYRVERALGGQLQGLSTDAGTFLLQLFGFPAAAEGHTIVLADLRMGVATACSGLSMLLIFIALAAAFASVVKRPLFDRAILVASAVPIALAVNIVRITATGALYIWAGPRIADLVFHDLAGWLMMPLALGLLWLELKFLSYVLVDDSARETKQVASGSLNQTAPKGPPCRSASVWNGDENPHESASARTGCTKQRG